MTIKIGTNAALAIWCAIAIFGGLAALLAWQMFKFKMNLAEMIVSACGILLFLTLVISLSWFYCFRLVTWLEIGEQFRFARICGERCVSWEEIGRFVVKETKGSFPEVRIHVTLVDATNISIWPTQVEADAALELVRKKPWARDWDGMPLGLAASWAVFLLGLIALGVGLYVAILVCGEFLNPLPGGRPSIPFLGTVAIGGPIVGLVALSFGGYHLFRRPVYYRAGVFHSRDKQVLGLLEKLRVLFFGDSSQCPDHNSEHGR